MRVASLGCVLIHSGRFVAAALGAHALPKGDRQARIITGHGRKDESELVRFGFVGPR